MNALIKTKSLEFRPSGELNQDHWWSGTGKAGRDCSDANQITLPYNMVMEIENLLRDLTPNAKLNTMSIKAMKRSIDSVLPECNPSQKRQTSIVENALSLLLTSNSLLSLLDKNPVDAYKADDDVILIEWSFKNFGLGFCLAPDSSDSGWYLTSNEKAGNILRSGLLTTDQEINNAAAIMISLLHEHIEELDS